MNEETSLSSAGEVRVATVDVWDLHHFKAPLQRIFARHAVERLELNHYVNELLATHRWDVLRVVPRSDGDEHAPVHVYDVYGRSWGPSA